MVLQLKNNIKTLTLIGTTIVSFSLLISFKTLAKDNISSNELKNLSLTAEVDSFIKQEIVNNTNTLYKSEVPINKRWKIKFNQPINPESIKDNIKVINKNSRQEISCYTYLDKYNLTVEIIPLSSCYNPDSEYLLVIDKGLISKYNKKLINPTTLDFKTDSIILGIDNINLIINQEDEYILPDTVSAKMSNETIKDFKVTWDKLLTLTSIPGKYTYYGTVDNYNKKVALNLTISPFQAVSNISNSKRQQSSLQVQLYNYLMNYDNRESVMKRAIELHDGDTSNTCVYFASEALRRSGLDMPLQVANTITLTSQLESYDWKTETDLSNLLPGDVCFTTAYGFGPTHSYIFMRWVDENHFDYAYICDNQGNEYNNNAYHKRNINFATAEKEAISYFMYMP